MAAGPAVVDIINDTLNLQGAGARYWRDRLCSERIIAGRKAVPTNTPLADVATLLTAILIGGRAATQSAVVLSYNACRSPDGQTLQDAIAGYLADPSDLLELAIDNTAPAAAIRHRDAKGSVCETTYMPDVVEPREGFSRISHLSANAFTALALAIRNAPNPTRRHRVRRNRKTT